MGKTTPIDVTEEITADFDFSAETTKDATIAVARNIRDVVSGRLYIDNDPGAFEAIAEITFYGRAAKHGKDVIEKFIDKLIYTEVDTATTGTDANVKPDDHTGFKQDNLIYFQDDDEEARLLTIATTMIAYDTIDAVHAVDVGISRIIELPSFVLLNLEGGTDIYVRIKFAASQTVSLKLELTLKK